MLFRHKVGVVKAVDGVSFTIERGETLGLVGESGCGKSTTSLAVLRMQAVDCRPHLLRRRRHHRCKTAAAGAFRRRMQMVYQDPYGSLDPRMKVRDIVGEPLVVHGMHKTRAEYRDRVAQLLATVGLLPDMAERYPHEFSGGQRQRIGIARALALEPSLVICDEPVSALDVSIQAQVINVLMELQQRLKLSYLFVAHDLAVVRHISHRVAVMYLGRIVEIADRDDAVSRPAASVHAGAAVGGAGGRPGGREPAPAPDPARRSAQRDAPAERLPLPPALPACDGRVQPGRSAAGRAVAGALGGLPPSPRGDTDSARSGGCMSHRPAAPEGSRPRSHEGTPRSAGRRCRGHQGGRMTERFDDKREAILDGAARLFNQHGIKGGLLSDLARRVGLATNSLTYYYRKKEDLATACLQRAIDALSDIAIAAAEQRTLAQRIRLFFVGYLKLLADIADGRHAELIVFSDLLSLAPPHGTRMAEAYTQMFRRVRALLDTPGQPRLDAPARNARAHLLLSTVSWARAWIARYEPVDYARAAGQMADLVLFGIAAPGRTVAAIGTSAIDLAPEVHGAADNANDTRAAYLRAATRW